jgi:hypothetical protein
VPAIPSNASRRSELLPTESESHVCGRLYNPSHSRTSRDQYQCYRSNDVSFIEHIAGSIPGQALDLQRSRSTTPHSGLRRIILTLYAAS